MNILFINTVPLDKNGISTFIMNNSFFLRKNKNYKVSLSIFNEISYELKNKLKKNEININIFPSRKKRPLNYFISLARYIKKNNFDIIYVHGNSTSMALELFAAYLGGCKVRVAHSHNTETEHPLLNKIMRPAFEMFITNRIACSEEAGKWLYGNKKFFLIKNGVNVENYAPRLEDRNKIRTNLGLKREDVLLGHIGGLNYQKNQEFLIDVIKKLDNRYKLVLIGNGQDYNKLHQKIEEYNLENRVFLIGQVENVSEYLSASDVFLMPSRYEGFPFALVEAQASGLVCLVSDTITTNTNITNNVHFTSILNTDPWANFLNKNLKNFSFDNRVRDIKIIQKMIRNAGYDSEKNGVYLSKVLEDMVLSN